MTVNSEVKPNLRILIVNPFGIGDVVFSFWMIEAIRPLAPEARIDYLCNERTEELVALNPSIGKWHTFNRDFFRKRLRSHPLLFLRDMLVLLAGLKRERYDIAFDLSLGREYAFVLMLLGVPRRIGFDYKGRGRFLTDKLSLQGFEGKPVRDHYLELVRLWKSAPVHGGYPGLRMDGSARRSQVWLGRHGMDRKENMVVISPGGGKSWGTNAYFKRWDAERFSEIASTLGSKYGFTVILLGDREEKELLESIRDKAGGIRLHVVAGESLVTVIDLMRMSRLFVGNDGGLSHLADLMHLPQVVLFGPVDEKVYGPLDYERTLVMTEPVPCRPCYRRFHFPPCPYEKRCLENIPVERVMKACEALIHG